MLILHRITAGSYETIDGKYMIYTPNKRWAYYDKKNGAISRTYKTKKEACEELEVYIVRQHKMAGLE